MKNFRAALQNIRAAISIMPQDTILRNELKQITAKKEAYHIKGEGLLRGCFNKKDVR